MQQLCTATTIRILAGNIYLAPLYPAAGKIFSFLSGKITVDVRIALRYTVCVAMRQNGIWRKKPCMNKKEPIAPGKKSTAKIIVKIIVGIFTIFTAVYGYRNSIAHIYELTCISNAACGIVLLFDGILNLRFRKAVPALVYQLPLLCILVVFSTCLFSLFGWHTFNFSGAFFFLHVVNPLLFFAVYLFMAELPIGDKADYSRRIWISPSMILCYLLFDYIRYTITGNLVYGLIPTEYLTAISVPFIGIGFYLLMVFMSYGLIQLKLNIQKTGK